MTNVTRRNFLEQIGVAAGLLLLGRGAMSFPKLSLFDSAKPFEILVVGDSHISGQGLNKKTNFIIWSRNGFNAMFSEHPKK